MLLRQQTKTFIKFFAGSFLAFKRGCTHSVQQIQFTAAFWHLYFFQFLQCISLTLSKVFLPLQTLGSRVASSPYEQRLSTGACWQGGGGGGRRATGGKGERPVTWLLKQLVAANHTVFCSISHPYFFQFCNRISLILRGKVERSVTWF